MLSSSRGQGNFRGHEASRPRTSKCVLENVLKAKDVLKDSTSVCYTSHKSQLLTYFCQSTLSSSLRDVVDCKTFSLGSQKVADLRCGLQILRSCGLQELRSCGLAVADFKNYEVADLRLRIQESRKVVADLRLRTKLLNVQLRTCGCGFGKLKFGCGFADCGLEKKLAVPSTVYLLMKFMFCIFTLAIKSDCLFLAILQSFFLLICEFCF